MKLQHTLDVPDELFAAARVSYFMEDDNSGRWRLRNFTVTQADHARNALKIQFGEKNSDRVELEMTRMVPPGDYITLARKMIDTEIRDIIFDNFGAYPEDLPEMDWDKTFPDDSRWIPVMSDTPAEILEHGPALINATGRVLITGLGLGCLPHALLTKDGVTRIDIIEIDPEVIALTGQYLTDPRVHIWQGSAADASVVPADLRWDYAWHDIWTHISPRNLDPEKAEHRIAYSTLRELWGGRVDGDTDCWAEDQAMDMERIQAEERAEEREFQRRLREASLNDAVDMTVRAILGQKLNMPWESVSDEAVKILDPDGELHAHVYRQLSAPDFWEKWDAKPDPSENPLGQPNEMLEANHG